MGKKFYRGLSVLVLAGLALLAGVKGGPWGPSSPVYAQTTAVKDVPEALYSLSRAGIARAAQADIRRMTPVELIEVVDGDTIKILLSPARPESAWGLAERENVRLIGFDAPETRHPSKGREQGGLEAKEGLSNLLAGQRLYLAFDRELRDRYGRLLAYVYTEVGQCVNLKMVEIGLAPALLRYPFSLKDEFAAVEKTARAAGRGLWAR